MDEHTMPFTAGPKTVGAGSELSGGLGRGLAFKAGDRVRLTTMANSYYGGVGRWTPEGQGGGGAGTIIYAGDRAHKPGADPRPYYVRWDNGAENSYREGDLKPAA